MGISHRKPPLSTFVSYAIREDRRMDLIILTVSVGVFIFVMCILWINTVDRDG